MFARCRLIDGDTAVFDFGEGGCACADQLLWCVYRTGDGWSGCLRKGKVPQIVAKAVNAVFLLEEIS